MKKDLKLNLKSTLTDLKKVGSIVQKYLVLIFIVTLISIYGFLVLQISQAAQREPSETEIAEQLNAVKKLKIDQQSIDKILQLKDQNIAVQSLFETARDNPFQE